MTCQLILRRLNLEIFLSFHKILTFAFGEKFLFFFFAKWRSVHFMRCLFSFPYRTGCFRPDGVGTVTVEERERFMDVKERLKSLIERQITHFRSLLFNGLLLMKCVCKIVPSLEVSRSFCV